MAGGLVLVVGPSGAGKDTLIGAAQERLSGDARFHFPRRTVTREAVIDVEDHDTMAPEAFAAACEDGAFALCWEAHGLSYGIPCAIEQAMAAGQTVVVNCSRRIIAEAMVKYPRCHVLVISALPEIRARRLAARGREREADIAARLAREGAPVPDTVAAITIDNSQALSEGIHRFVAALEAVAGAQAPAGNAAL